MQENFGRVQDFQDEEDDRSPTLICDYSENELNQLFVRSQAMLTDDEKSGATFDYQLPGAGGSNFQSSPDKKSKKGKKASSATKNSGVVIGDTSISHLERGEADKGLNMLTKLDDDEENVNFIEMFNEYQVNQQQSKQHPNQQSFGSQVQYYQPLGQGDQQQPDSAAQAYTAQQQSQPLPQIPEGSPGQQKFQNFVEPEGSNQYTQGSSNLLPKPARKGKSGVRPSSATVAGQANRFLMNQNSKRKTAYGGKHQIDQISYSYQQPLLPQSSGKAISTVMQFGTHRNSSNNFQAAKPPSMHGQPKPVKKTRPQSAARNQMQPSKQLGSVTNFTYQKAKQNHNQKAFLPDSLKNTDYEKIYEDRMHLKKQVNQMMRENLLLRTQLQSQHGLIKKKDEMVQQVMKQVFHPKASSPSLGDEFLQEFQTREIQHQAIQPKISASLFYKSGSLAKVKGSVPVNKMPKPIQGTSAFKDSQITQLKLKMKEVNDLCFQKEKELVDLKQTLKFTKIKEYETELALNVQESQRLRGLLEREISKPKIDPRYVQHLKQQIMQLQQMIQGHQQNEQVQAQNIEKMNKKLINQIKKFSKLKEARKKVVEKNSRLEKKVAILQNKLNAAIAENQQQHMKKATKFSRPSSAPQAPSGESKPIVQLQQQVRSYESQKQSWQQSSVIQKQIIDKLIIKIQNYDIDLTEDELIEMQKLQQLQHELMQEQLMNDMEFQQKLPEPMEQIEEMPAAEQQTSTMHQDDEYSATRKDEKDADGGLDVILTLVPTKESQRDREHMLPDGFTKQLLGIKIDSFEELEQVVRESFELQEGEKVQIKFVDERESELEVTSQIWEQIKLIGKDNQIQLNVYLAASEKGESNYEDDFEEEENVVEKEFMDIVPLVKVKDSFEELRLILCIKHIKREDALKFILKGVRDETTGRKIRNVSIECFQEALVRQVGFSRMTAMKMAKFLIEAPGENGKVEKQDNLEYKGQTHEQATKIRRKLLQGKLLSHIKEYMLYNGLAITSMLTRLQEIFEEQKEELGQDLEDGDFDDLGTASLEDIFKSMKINGVNPDTMDEELRDFLLFLIMRKSQSLKMINYKDLMKVFESDYNLVEDPSIWEKEGEDLYERSSDDGELKTESSVEMKEEPAPEEEEEEAEPETAKKDSDGNYEMDQNELLERVDEILMQIVQKLPPNQKVRNLTQIMMPYLQPIMDSSQTRQYLIIQQEAFIQFLMGTGPNSLGLDLSESHIVCLLHLLVQEEEDDDESPKFILYDEFVELIKTYMKKEQILMNSKGLGIHYDILSKESVEFLFQIRSQLMHETAGLNINENSGDEEEEYPDPYGGSSSKKQKSLPSLIRTIFSKIITKRNVSLGKSKKPKSQQFIEVMDFDEMLDALFSRMGIHCPKTQAQEEIKYLLCLDFKYLELVMLVKFDKVMHDLDYISIDLLRQAQDKSQAKVRRKALEYLRGQREEQLSKMKAISAEKQVMKGYGSGLVQSAESNDKYSTAQAENSQGMLGVSHSTKQEKRKKRPDDKKQNVLKRQQYSNNMSLKNNSHHGEGRSIGHVTSSTAGKQSQSQQHAVSKSKTTYDQDFNGRGQNLHTHSSKKRMDGLLQKDSNIEVEIGVAQDRAAGLTDVYNQMDDFDNIDVNLDTDINQKAFEAPIDDDEQQISEDYEDDDLQDDIPIDDDEGEDEEGIISDNYENFTDMRKRPGDEDDVIDESMPDQVPDQEKTPKSESPQKDDQNDDDNVISMEHSDDLVDSRSHNLRGGMTDEKVYKMREQHTTDDISGDPRLTGMDEQYTDDIGEVEEDDQPIEDTKEEDEEEYEVDNLIQEDAILALQRQQQQLQEMENGEIEDMGGDEAVEEMLHDRGDEQVQQVESRIVEDEYQDQMINDQIEDDDEEEDQYDHAVDDSQHQDQESDEEDIDHQSESAQQALSKEDEGPSSVKKYPGANEEQYNHIIGVDSRVSHLEDEELAEEAKTTEIRDSRVNKSSDEEYPEDEYDEVPSMPQADLPDQEESYTQHDEELDKAVTSGEVEAQDIQKPDHTNTDEGYSDPIMEDDIVDSEEEAARQRSLLQEQPSLKNQKSEAQMLLQQKSSSHAGSNFAEGMARNDSAKNLAAGGSLAQNLAAVGQESSVQVLEEQSYIQDEDDYEMDRSNDKQHSIQQSAQLPESSEKHKTPSTGKEKLKPFQEEDEYVDDEFGGDDEEEEQYSEIEDPIRQQSSKHEASVHDPSHQASLHQASHHQASHHQASLNQASRHSKQGLNEMSHPSLHDGSKLSMSKTEKTEEAKVGIAKSQSKSNLKAEVKDDSSDDYEF